MRNDDHLIFENYFNKLGEARKATSSHGTPIYNRPTSAPGPKPGYDAIQNTINQKLSQKPGSTPKKAEDAESDNTAVKELHDVLNILRKQYISGRDLDNDTLGNVISEIDDILSVGFGSPSEDAEEHCKYAKEGCDCNKCSECKDNKEENAESSADDIMAKIEAKRKSRKNIGSVRSEDAETYGVEGKIQSALHEIESFGYTGDHIDPMEVAKLVVGSPSDWGDSYQPLVQALEVVISNYYEKGLQDS